MAEVLLIVHPTPKYEDGDVLCAFSRRRIRDVHAQHICDQRHVARNRDGWLPLDCLTRRYLEATCEYRNERIARQAVMRTNLFTGDADVITDRLNARGEATDVEMYLRRRAAHRDKEGTPKNLVFGTDGAEVWYGGRTRAGDAQLDQVWTQIEQHSPFREVAHRTYPLSDYERREWLVLPVEDFTEDEGAALVAPEMDGETTVRARQRSVRWRDLFPHAGPTATVEDVLDRSKIVDVRTRAVPFARAIVRQKPTRVR